jgi:arabinan endo-1,5-alpha-L-arabinosidase
MRAHQVPILGQHSQLAQGIVACNDFKLGIGPNVPDVSGNGNTGVGQGTLGSQWGRGKIGGGGAFNGVGYVVIPHLCNISATPFSVSAWLLPTSTTQSPIFEDWSGLGGGFAFQFVIASGKLSLQLRNTVAADIFTTGLAGGSVVTNQWQHAAFTWNPLTKTGSLYLNGTLVAAQVSGLSNVALLNTTNVWNIGRKQDSNTVFPGSLDEVAIWPRALTANDVAILWANGQGKAYPFN